MAIGYATRARRWIRRVALPIAGVLFLPTAGTTGEAPQDNFTLRLLPQYRLADDRSPFFVPGDDRQGSVREDILWRHEDDLLTFQWSGMSLHSEGDEPIRRGVLNELFIDRSLGEFEVTLGKKMMTYGVGHSFRPLDVIQRERNLPLQPMILEGVPVATLEYYTDVGAYSAIYVHRLDADDQPYRGDVSEYALRTAFTYGPWDLRTLAHYAEATGWSLGAGFETVSGEALSFYGSLLHQQRHRLPQSTLLEPGPIYPASDAPPMVWREEGAAVKGVAGFSWTWSSGFSLIGELAYNGAARDADDWRDLLRLAQAQRALMAQPGMDPRPLAAALQAEGMAFGLSNFVQQALFLRLSYDGDKLDPRLEVLHSPDAGGGFVTAHLDVEVGNRHKMALGARHYFGGRDTPFGAQPTDSQIYLSWEWAFGLVH
jgi:hypothetical protein